MTGLGDLTWETLTYVCRMTSSNLYWVCYNITTMKVQYIPNCIDIHDDCIHQPNKTNEFSLQGKFYLYMVSSYMYNMYAGLAKGEKKHDPRVEWGIPLQYLSNSSILYLW